MRPSASCVNLNFYLFKVKLIKIMEKQVLNIHIALFDNNNPICMCVWVQKKCVIGTFTARVLITDFQKGKKNVLNAKCLFFLFWIAKHKIFRLKLMFQKLKFYCVEHFVCLLSVRRQRTEAIIIKWSECIGFNVNGSGFCHTHTYTL